jgi:hypothetical protein
MTRPTPDIDLHAPIPDSYIVPGARLVAGEYPGTHPDEGRDRADAKLASFLNAGIDTFIDLTHEDDGMAPYAARLIELGSARGMDVVHDPLPIIDMNVCAPEHMTRVLDTIDGHLADGRTVYVHCWGGVGRTGMTVGCWLVRHGMEGEEAMETVGRLFATMSPAKRRRHHPHGSPQTPAQRNVVRSWASAERRA